MGPIHPCLPLSVGLHVATVLWQHPKNEHRVCLNHTAPLPPTHMQHSQAHRAGRCSSCGTPNRAVCAPQPRHSTPCNSTVVCWGAVLARADRRRQMLSETQLLLRMLCAAAKKHAARAAMPLLQSGTGTVLDQAKPAINVTQPSNSTCDLQLSQKRDNSQTQSKSAAANAGSCCPQR